MFGKRHRVNTPTILQNEAVECGAAALGIILHYYKKYISLEELRLACGVSRDGSNALNIIKAARHYGLKAGGFKRDSLQEIEDLGLPVILFWNFNHFVVLEGFDDRRICINDPATGPRTVTPEEFNGAFTGVVIACEPGVTFEKSGEKFSLPRALRKRLVGSEIALIYIILAGLFLLIPGIILPAFLRVFVDDILVNGQDWVKPLLAGMALAFLLRGGLSWLQRLMLLRLETRLALQSSEEFLWHVLHLPLEFFAQRHSGDIAFRVQLNDRIARLLSSEVATTFIEALLLMFYGILMLQYDVILTLMGVIFIMLNLILLNYVSRIRADSSHRLLQERGKQMGISMNGLRSIETIKASGTEDDFFARWMGTHTEIINVEQQLGYVTLLLMAATPFLLALNTAIVLIFGTAKIMNGQMTAGMLVAFQSLMQSFIYPINQLVNMGSQLQEVQGDVHRLDDVLNYPRRVLPGELHSPPIRLTGKLEIRHLSFGYNHLAAPFIDGFDLSVEPGQMVALVGATGSGKSTVVRLVAGLFQPRSGDILLDDRPIELIAPKVLSQSRAMVDQTITLFSGSIRDNLTLWNSAIPETDIIEAAIDAGIHDFILSCPGGYDYQVEENGRNFSGGQRQSLEIARALTLKPPLLILDEATAALDAVTEARIMDNLRTRGCTCLIVAHRLSAIKHCDVIVMMNKGIIIEQGTHTELMELDGYYAELVKSSQF